jgi:hypothetical protein
MSDPSLLKVIRMFRRRSIVALSLKLVGILVVISIPFANAVAKFAARSRASSAANTTLVSGIFAAGTGGSPLASANFRMLGTLGEAALPNNQTILASANFQLQPGFLAYSPAAVSSGIGPLFLPMVIREEFQYFVGTEEAEPNNSRAQANGPLQSGVDYHGYQNDTDDYFSISLSGSGNIAVDLDNANSLHTQVLLYHESSNSFVRQSGGEPFQLSYSGPSGIYYIRVFSDAPNNNPAVYTLRVTYP